LTGSLEVSRYVDLAGSVIEYRSDSIGIAVGLQATGDEQNSGIS